MIHTILTFQNRFLVTRALILCVTVMSFCIVSVLPSSALESKRVQASVESKETAFALKTLGVIPYNTSALDNRQVLLFVHGIAPEAGELFGWGNLIQSIEASEKARLENTEPSDVSDGFFRRYKVYFFSYDPADNVTVNAKRLKHAVGYLAERSEQRAVEAWRGITPPTTIKAVALSLGGLIYQQAMADDEIVLHATEQVITLGSPLHGTPIANPPWMRSALKKGSFLSPLRFGRRTIYRLVEDKFPSFKTDFCWDNTDQLMPADFVKAVPCQRNELSDEARSKFVTYAAYFGVDKETQAVINDALALPEEYGLALLETTDTWSDKSPTNKHGMMEMMQKYMTRLPIASKNGDAEIASLSEPNEPTELPAMYALSDGVSPIYSQLWLGRFMPTTSNRADEAVASNEAHSIKDNRSKSNIQSALWHNKSMVQAVQPETVSASVSPLPQQKWVSDSNLMRAFASPDSASPSFIKTSKTTMHYSVDTSWNTLATLRNKPNVRLFYGLDHRDWTEGSTRWKNVSSVCDMLHTDQPKKPLYQWLLTDVMQPAR